MSNYKEASFFSWETEGVNEYYLYRAHQGEGEGTCSPSKGYEPFELAGDALTPEAAAKLRLIAQHQEVSAKAEEVEFNEEVPQPESNSKDVIPDVIPRFDLAEYCKFCNEYFSKGLTELGEDQSVADYMDFAITLIIYVGWKSVAKCSLKSIGEVYGLTKKQAESRVNRLQRRIDKGGVRSDAYKEMVLELTTDAFTYFID